MPIVEYTEQQTCIAFDNDISLESATKELTSLTAAQLKELAAKLNVITKGNKEKVATDIASSLIKTKK